MDGTERMGLGTLLTLRRNEMKTMEQVVASIAPEARGPWDLTMFKSDVDEQEFRQYSRENPPRSRREDNDIFHPYCRDEWYRMGVLPERTKDFTI